MCIQYAIMSIDLGAFGVQKEKTQSLGIVPSASEKGSAW